MAVLLAIAVLMTGRLDSPCVSHSMCIAPHSLCLGGRCACDDGYIAQLGTCRESQTIRLFVEFLGKLNSFEY